MKTTFLKTKNKHLRAYLPRQLTIVDQGGN